MNREIVSRLYQEAVDFCVAAEPNPDGTNKAWLFEEKFAELLVNECVTACEKNSWITLNAFQRSKQIKQHFGIK